MTRHLRATAAILAVLTLALFGCGDDLPETEEPSLDQGDVTPPTTG